MLDKNVSQLRTSDEQSAGECSEEEEDFNKEMLAERAEEQNFDDEATAFTDKLISASQLQRYLEHYGDSGESTRRHHHHSTPKASHLKSKLKLLNEQNVSENWCRDYVEKLPLPQESRCHVEEPVIQLPQKNASDGKTDLASKLEVLYKLKMTKDELLKDA
ncbi:unnamed protein product, partial [Lymnaea stagnalis]